MKKILFFAFFILLVAFVFVKSTESKNRPYYSGEAIAYSDHVYVGSTNSGYLEVFRSNGKSDFETVARLKNYDARFNEYKEFSDLEFNIENGRLFVYAISEYSIFKYEVKTNGLEFITKETNTYWEWYSRIDKFGSKMATISAKGVKILNNNLEVIDAYDIVNENSPYSLRADNDRYILNVTESHLEIYDRESRSVVQKIALNFRVAPNNRKAYQDKDMNVYVVDDYYTKKYNLEGKLLASFRHLDHEGYDATGSGMNGSFYFSNGMGIVRLSKKDLSVEGYVYTYNLGATGAWAMGLEVVHKNNQEYIAVFNSKNILLLDNKLNKIASVSSTEKEDPYPFENLYLNLNHKSAMRGAEITLSGGGFISYQSLEIDFAGKKSKAQADSLGRFSTKVIVPDKSGPVDIKVTGDDSKLNYSISFTIVEKK